MSAPFGNHNSLGHRCTEESRHRMSMSKIGRILSKETKDKMRHTHLKNLKSGREIRIGRLHTNEEIEKIRLSSIGRVFSNESKQKISNSKLGEKHPLYGKHLNREWANKISKSLKGKPKTEQFKLIQKKRWENIEDKNKRIQAMIKSNHIKPNKPENIILYILESTHPNEYKYTGDGSVIIDGLCPDFTNCNGQKKVIELFGDYWHKGENPQIKIDRYAKFGFGCLVIWEKELKDIDSVKERIKVFNEVSH